MHSLAVRITKDVCFLRWRRPHCPRCRARCEPVLGRHAQPIGALIPKQPCLPFWLECISGSCALPLFLVEPALQQWARRRWPCRSGAAIGLKAIKSIAASAYGISLGCRFGLIFLAASDTVQQLACAARISNAKTQRNASHSARLTETPPLSKAAQLPAAQPVRATPLAGLWALHRLDWFFPLLVQRQGRSPAMETFHAPACLRSRLRAWHWPSESRAPACVRFRPGRPLGTCFA